jgi:adenosylhomocysteine nucleosidase
MTERIYSGITNLSGTTTFHGPVAAGDHPVVYATTESPRPDAFGRAGQGVDVGVVTVIPEEARAVNRVLGLQSSPRDGLAFDIGTVQTSERPVTIAALQSLSQGQDAAGSAFSHLREYFSPAITVLTGIAGGIHPRVRLGDVIVATRVICYDLRKETPERTIRRGHEGQAPAEAGHAVNRFFARHGEPAHITCGVPGTAGQEIRVLEGPIGSGNAVIAQRDSAIVQYLLAFNDKTLAVDMESGGLIQAHHGLPAARRAAGWLVIRGISDHANEEKNDDYHQIAATHAAAVLREMLPYLPEDRAVSPA